MKKVFFLVLASFFAFYAASQTADTEKEGKLFAFIHNEGQIERILSHVEEDVYINDVFHHHARIMNRITSETVKVTSDKSAQLKGTFITSENSTGANKKAIFQWENEYESVFTRKSNGKYIIGKEFLLPTVRGVPTFPERKLKKGDTWQEEGSEVHDLSRTFEMKEPFIVPFTATYSFEGEEKDGNKTYSIIIAQYSFSYRSPVKPSSYSMFNLPEETAGYSKQRIRWDDEKGGIESYEEEFSIQIKSFSGNVFTFEGTAEAKTEEVIRSSTQENKEKLSGEIEKLGIENVEVKQKEEGLSISIENIAFEPDSSRLTKKEKEKLKRISSLLKTFKNDILIIGHCAKRGMEAAQMEISQDRAKSVANFLLKEKVREASHIFTTGKGAKEPVGNNDTREGRMRNRRVEIILLDK